MKHAKIPIIAIALLIISFISIASAEFTLVSNQTVQDTQSQTVLTLENQNTESQNMIVQNPPENTNTFILENQNTNNNINAANTIVLENQNTQTQTLSENTETQNSFEVIQYSISNDFTFYTQKQEINLCSCTGIFDKITLQNT